MLKNQVPTLWSKVAYPSLKPLSSWFKDLDVRVRFFTSWLKDGQPACFHLPAFFFQQGFMCATPHPSHKPRRACRDPPSPFLP